MVDPTYQPKNYDDQGGDRTVIGGELQIAPGGKITADGVQAGALVALVDNSGGAAANGTIEAIPDPADAPASVDALRDDLVANTLPALRNAITELTTRLNAATAALKGAGITA